MQINRYASEVERKKSHFAQYNILPLHVSGASEIMELPEVAYLLISLLACVEHWIIFFSFLTLWSLQIRAALKALRKVDDLPRLGLQSKAYSQNLTNNALVHDDGDHSINDLLDWLGFMFRFQVKSIIFFMNSIFFLCKFYCPYFLFIQLINQQIQFV